MKRSIICLSVLVLFVVIGTGAEIVYSKTLSDKLEDTIKICKETDNFESRSEACYELSEYFDTHETFNNIFFTRKFTERIAIEISNLNVYAKAKDEKNFEASLNRLDIYTEDMLF